MYRVFAVNMATEMFPEPKVQKSFFFFFFNNLHMQFVDTFYMDKIGHSLDYDGGETML